MDNKQIIEKTIAYVQAEMSGESSGHDWWHVHQVWQNARRIAEAEGANLFICELAALLHDIRDYKFHGGNIEIGPSEARRWLSSCAVTEEIIVLVSDIIRDLSFKGAGVKSEMKTLEGKVVQDADRLEALGAIGIARTFAYGGNQNKLIYDPEIKPVFHTSFEQYITNQSHTINHFYEKLFLLKDLMNTRTGKLIATKRHNYMQGFIRQFMAEWSGEM